LLFFFQAEDGIRDRNVTGVQTCALPISYRLGQNEDGIFSDSTALQKLTSYAQLFNMDKESGLEISESTPQVSDSMPIPSAIGQGTHNYTTSQLARYVASLANSGTSYNISLLDKVTDASGNLI